MEIQRTQRSDLPVLLGIFADARRFMAENGNPNQWGDRFPTREMLEADIAAGHAAMSVWTAARSPQRFTFPRRASRPIG